MIKGILRLIYIVFWSTFSALISVIAGLISYTTGISNEHTTHKVFQFWASKARCFTHSCMGEDLIDISPSLKDHPTLITANHSSWIDIYLLVTLYQHKTPVMLFVLKRQLLYIPLFGLVAYLMGCPFLSRSGHRSDLRIIQNAVKKSPHACFTIFPEGTRFKKEKLDTYKHVLNPKALGANIILKYQENPKWLDCHIHYSKPPSLLAFIMGRQGKIIVKSEWVEPIDKNSINTQWDRKEKWLADQS